jgi:hypothetical protein
MENFGSDVRKADLSEANRRLLDSSMCVLQGDGQTERGVRNSVGRIHEKDNSLSVFDPAFSRL